MNKFYLALAVLLFAVLFPFEASANKIASDLTCRPCCDCDTPDNTSSTGPAIYTSGGSYIALTEATLGDDYPVVSGLAANGSGIELSFR